MASARRLLGFLCLGLLSVTNAWFNESELREIYVDAEELYWDADYHWNFGQGYSDMLGAPGMAVCFVEGPERTALVLGGSQNSTNVTIELQHQLNPVSLPVPVSEFTVSLWYSFRPVDFYAQISESIDCDLITLGDLNSNEVKISYNGMKEYNLTYMVSKNEDGKMKIADNRPRQNWEFEVNDTVNGGVVMRGWQWNHIALVYSASTETPCLKAYFNGQLVNGSTEGIPTSLTGSNLNSLYLNGKAGQKACPVVGFDEVAVWDWALTGDDVLALRLHVGRNRSMDRAEPTTSAPPSTEPPTTPAPTSEGVTTGYTGASTTGTSGTSETSGSTSSSSSLATSTGTSDSGSTGGSTGGTTSRTTGGGSSSDSSASPTTASGTDSTSGGSSSGGTTKDGTTNNGQSSTASIHVQQLQNAASAISENHTHAQASTSLGEINEALATVDQATPEMAEIILSALSATVHIPAPPEGSNQTVLATIESYRQQFVSVVSTLLDIMEPTETDNGELGEALVGTVETFVQSIANDQTANETVITQQNMALVVTTGGANTIGDNHIDIPLNTVGTDTLFAVCVMDKPPNIIGHGGSVQTSIAYSVQPTWNISSALIIVKTSGQGGSVNLSEPIRITFTVTTVLGLPLCAFQDGCCNMSDSGVTTISFDPASAEVMCEINHLTNFAVLMSVDGVELEGGHAIALSLISYIGCGLSLFCLTLALIIFIVLRELTSTRMGIVKNLCVALFLAQLLFVAGIQTATASEIACKAVAAMLHYFFLSVIAWMLCNGIYLYQKVNSGAKPGGMVDLIYFCILGWGAPAVVVAITAGVNHKVYGSAELCWLTVEGSGIWAFVIPAMLIILFNAFVTFLTMKAFMSVKVFKDKSEKDKFKSGLRAIIVMLPILGLSWIFGLLAFGEAGIFFQYLFAIFNSLQGVFLFIFHIFLNEEVKSGMRRRFGKVGASGEENTLFNKIWAFSGTTSNAERSTQMSSVTQTESLSAKPVYKN